MNRISSYLLLILVTLLGNRASAQDKTLLIPYLDGHKWGYCNKEGKVILAPQWDVAGDFGNGKARVELNSDKEKIVCLIDQQGRYIIPPERHWTGELPGNGKACPENAHDGQGNYGCIDSNNRALIPLAFDRYPNFACVTAGYYYACKNKKAALIKEGKVMLPAAYDAISIVNGARIPLFVLTNVDSGETVIDSTGKVLLSFDRKYGVSFWFDNGTLFWTRNNQVSCWHHIPSGQPVATPFSEINRTDLDGRYFVRQNNKWGIADNLGNILLSPAYDDVYSSGGVLIGENSLLADKNPQARYAYVFLDTFTLKPKGNKILSPQSGIEQYRREQQTKSKAAFHPIQTAPGKFDEVFQKDGIIHYRKGNTCLAVYEDAGPNGSYRDMVNNYRSFLSVALLDCRTDKITGYSIADYQLNLKAPPQPRKIFYVARKGKMVVLWDGHGFSLADSNLHEVIAPQALKIDPNTYFKRNGKHYVFADEDSKDAFVRKRKVIGEDGRLLAQFEPYLAVRFNSRKEPKDYAPVVVTEPVVATDKSYKEGFLDFEGRVLFPAISFKHRYVRQLGDNLFFVADQERTQGTLLDKNNQPLLPAPVVISAVYSLKPSGVLHDYSEDAIEIPDVYRVYCPAYKFSFYINGQGKAYVKDWAFLTRDRAGLNK